MDEAALIKAIERKDIAGALALVKVDDKAVRDELTKGLRSIFEDSGSYTVERLRQQLKNPPTGHSPKSIDLRFDVVNPRAVQWVRERSASLVTNITEGMRDGIRVSMARAFQEGLPPKEAAKLIKVHIGLTERDEERIRKVAEVERAAGTSEAGVAKLVKDMSREAIQYRSLVIARHETIVGSYEGAREGWRQADDEGLLPAEAVQEWIDTSDERTCPICDELNGKTAPLDQSFGDVNGVAVYQPGDPHVQCRCGVVMRPFGKGEA